MNEATARHRLADAIQGLVKVSMKWDDKKARYWMTTDNPMLGNCAPIQLIMRGRSHKVLGFVETALDENNGPGNRTRAEG